MLQGTLRVLLVLLHDFPEFLCDYHFSFCDVIPPNCIQMRNLILSAFPRNMRLPDPFTPNLKVLVRLHFLYLFTRQYIKVVNQHVALIILYIICELDFFYCQFFLIFLALFISATLELMCSSYIHVYTSVFRWNCCQISRMHQECYRHMCR